MAKIDNWIKEQLKKGYKKEQIKESMRKAGYQQNTIDSVDSFARKKILGYLPYLVIFLVIILVFFIAQQFYSPDSKGKRETKKCKNSFNILYNAGSKEWPLFVGNRGS